jgi:diguanylate cyclase (GGDEF)-like protein
VGSAKALARRAAIAVLAIIAYFALPSPWKDWWFELFPLAAGLLLLRASIRDRANRVPWLLFGIGLLLFCAGDTIWTYIEVVEHRAVPYPSIADVLYLSAYVPLVVAVVVIARRRLLGRDRGGLLDAGVVGVSFALFMWVYAMAPAVSDPSLASSGRLVSLAYPTMDIALLAVVVRVAMGGAFRVRADRLLLGVLSVLLVADVIYALLSVHDNYQSGMWVDGFWLAAYAGWGLVALQPPADAPVPVPRARRLTPTRLVLLAAASLVAPGVLAVQGLAGDSLQLPAVIAACTVLFLLVIGRMADLMREIQIEATHDSLTGLPNRLQLELHLAERVDAASRHGARVPVLFADLDRFKVVNDSLGHAGGDALLKVIAERMRFEVGAAGFCSRYAGDEFVIVLNDGEDPVAVAHRLSAALAAPVDINGTTVHPSASVGITVSSPDVRNAEALLQDADLAMFFAKGQGDVSYVMFEERMRADAGRLQLEAALRASNAERFEVHYQPIVAAGDLQITGYEALVRWRDDDGNLRGPASFLPVAEDVGLIVNIGAAVLAHASRFALDHLAATGVATEVYVNLSARELSSPGLAERVRTTWAATGLDPALLHLEISERALAGEEHEEVLDALAELGFRIDLDDFGVGTSALPRLRRRHFSTLKVDRSLVHGITASSRDRAIVEGLVTIATGLGMVVVAEGVERTDDLATLRTLGCHRVQGFLTGRPAPAAEWLTPDRISREGSTSVRPV